MFTGLIESVGSVTQVSDQSGTRRIVVESPAIACQLKTGDSVAVSGVCLTALNITTKDFAADLAAETLARTSLVNVAVGEQVNLELAMPATSRLGGHVVQGHVDGVGRLVQLSKIRGREDYWLDLSVPPGLGRYVVEKGSIAIEGISLTVASITADRVRVAIIPHTFAATNLHAKKSGDQLNIEVDVLAKYAEKQRQEKSSTITVERLLEEGF